MGVTTEVIDGYKKCGSWKACKGDSKLKAAYERRSIEYNEEIVEELQRHEEIQQAPFDLIVLAGYMRLVKQPLLDAYPDKIINVHPSSLPVDLSLREKRRFIGEDAVYDAIKEGQTRTCSSVIMVDSLEDHGEILTQGPNLLVWNEFLYGTVSQREEWFREYADVHQTLQKVRSDFPALTTALKMISQGEIALGSKKRYYDEWRRVYVNGEPMPYSGLKVRLP
ncbi:hypothetical protein GOV12_03845 [Candidatus Pacearchaeota archaeon]|nr:hypothetical protein [Candidatus Pacearchaeota archaeon]